MKSLFLIRAQILIKFFALFKFQGFHSHEISKWKKKISKIIIKQQNKGESLFVYVSLSIETKKKKTFPVIENKNTDQPKYSKTIPPRV